MASFIRLASFRASLEAECSRRIVGFDAFGEFPRENLTLESDNTFVDRFEAAGGPGLDIDEATALMNAKGFGNFELIKGNLFDTLLEYLDRQPQTRIAFLHLDMDVKEPTTFALEHLFDRVVKGGLIVLDDYNAIAGETDAVDDFLAGKKLSLEKLPFYSVPAFIRKD